VKLVLKKCVCYKLGRVLIYECEHDRTDYFSDLMINEALSKYLKSNKISISI